MVCLQNHDQAGNRAKGDRFGHSVDPELVKLGAAPLLLSPFVRLLFQGEEWSASSPSACFTDHGEPELAEAVRAGRRREFVAFGWKPEEIPDPQSPETFLVSKLRWAERSTEPHRGTLTWYKELIRLRKRLGETTSRTELGIHFNEHRRFLLLDRGSTRLALNFANQDQSLDATHESELVAASRPGATVSEGILRIPARAAVILRIGPLD